MGHRAVRTSDAGAGFGRCVTVLAMARANRKAPGEYSSHGPVTPRVAGVPSGQKWMPSGERTVLVPFGPQLGSMLIQGNCHVNSALEDSTAAPAFT